MRDHPVSPYSNLRSVVPRRVQVDLDREGFADSLDESEVAEVLEWALQQIQHEGAVDSHSRDDGHDEPDDEPPEPALGRLDRELADRIFDRALSGPTAYEHVATVAAIALRRMRRSSPPPIPAPADLEDNEGREAPNARQLRRNLAGAIIEQATADGTLDPGQAIELVYDWRATTRSLLPPSTEDDMRRTGRSRLLDAGDFDWVFGEVTHAHARRRREYASAMVEIAGYLFDMADIESAELAYANQNHLVWPAVRWWFEPMAIDSEEANRWRRHRRRADEREAPILRENELVGTLHEQLDGAVAGDAGTFVSLVLNLRLDPETGRGTQRFDDNLLEYPAFRALAPGAADLLSDVAFSFVTQTEDGASEWLGTNVYQHRAWAGYLALALLDRHREGSITFR
ncbi:MAG: hypothetical protein QOE61_2928 [Micromonosporaceae bacterium]|nr:hypothetical protein [Micromonosporaceae bacterium]